MTPGRKVIENSSFHDIKNRFLQQEQQHLNNNPKTISRASTLFPGGGANKPRVAPVLPIRSGRPTDSPSTPTQPINIKAETPTTPTNNTPPTPPPKPVAIERIVTKDISSPREEPTTNGHTEPDEGEDSTENGEEDIGPQKIDFDEQVITARERRGRIPSIHMKRPAELDRLIENINKNEKQQSETKRSSWMSFGKKTASSPQLVSRNARPVTMSAMPSSTPTSPLTSSVVSSLPAPTTPLSPSNDSDQPIVGQRYFVEKKGATLIVRFPVNLFAPTSGGDSSPKDARPKSISRNATLDKNVHGGVKISLFATNEFYQVPVECLVISNTSDLSCSGNNNAYFAQELANVSAEVANQCKEYLNMTNIGRLKAGKTFCGTTGKIPNVQESHVIHLYLDHTQSNDLPIVSSETDTNVLPLDKLVQTKLYASISAGVRSALENADALTCASIAFCPTQAPVTNSGGQYGCEQKHWIHAQRCIFQSIFEYHAENKFSCSVMDFRMITCTAEEGQLLRKFLDVDYKSMLMKHYSETINAKQVVSTITTPTSPPTPQDEVKMSPKKVEPKDPAQYYDCNYRTIKYNAVEDSPDNIEWMAEGSEDEIVDIKCATLDKLIERVTFHKNYDNAYLYAFLLTYRSFTTPHGLMDKLMFRYNIPPPAYILEKTDKQEMMLEFGKWQSEYLNQVRMRITQVLKYWLEKHHYDFTADDRLVEKVQNICITMEKTQGTAYAQQIQRMLKKKNEIIANRKILAMSSSFSKQVLEDYAEEMDETLNFPKTIYPKKGRDNLSAVPLIDWPEEEIARQITYAEYIMFKSIVPKECLNQSWNKNQREERAPHIFQMINWFNKLSKWVVICVLEKATAKERKTVIKKLIRIAQYCRQLNNFNAVFEIVSGLQNAAIYRLNKSWEALSVSTKKVFDEMVALISRDGNYRMIRQAILHVKPPCIPYIGVFLTDLTYVLLILLLTITDVRVAH
jgi:hypothetical protein